MSADVATKLLKSLTPAGTAADGHMIRLDLTPEQLEVALAAGRLAIGGAHPATAADPMYRPGAIVPDPPQSLDLSHYGLVRPLLVRAGTPASLRVGFGPVPAGIEIGRALSEAAARDFVSGAGSAYDLGRYGVGWLLDVLHSRPGEITTVIPRPTAGHLTPGIDTARYVGLHYDQQPARSDGWVERLPAGSRIGAGRRILVNAGPGRRVTIAGLNFSALQFAELFAPGDPGYLPCTSDLIALMNAKPELLATLVVLHIVIRPGELAEVCPANTVHDGSMRGCERASSCVVFTMGPGAAPAYHDV
jgi:hypothetical protein